MSSLTTSAFRLRVLGLILLAAVIAIAVNSKSARIKSAAETTLRDHTIGLAEGVYIIGW